MVQRGGAYLNEANRISIINNFKITHSHNQYYSGSPELNEVERYSKNKIETISIKDMHQKNKSQRVGNTLNVYRPAVQSREPQPSQYRTVQPAKIKPIFHDEKPTIQRHDQQQNVRQLQVQRSQRTPQAPLRNSGDTRNNRRYRNNNSF